MNRDQAIAQAMAERVLEDLNRQHPSIRQALYSWACNVKEGK